MNDMRVEELLLKVIEDMAIVKSRLESIEEIKTDTKLLEERVNKLESSQTTHKKQVEILENRQETLEKFIRDDMTDSKKQNKSIIVSVIIAVCSALVSIVVSIF